MNKVLVTGAGGYIGRHVVAELLNRKVDVIAADIKLDGIDKRAECLKYNFLSGEKDVYSEIGKPDVIIHMAWRDGFIHNSDKHMEDLSKHYKFIKDLIDGGAKHIVVMGTMHEIGYHEGEIDENTITNPTSMYGIAKNALRRSIQLIAKDNNVTIQWLRAYYIYGDDKRNSSVFAKILLADEDGKKFFPFTSGKNKYDFIKVTELAKQIAACSLQNEITGIINCCTGKPISLGEKVENFIFENKLDIKLNYGEFPDRPYDSPAVWGNNRKIKEILIKDQRNFR